MAALGIIGWLSTGVFVLLDLAVIAIALSTVRQAHDGAGFTLAGAAGFSLLGMIVSRAGFAIASSLGSMMDVMAILDVLSLGMSLVTGVLVVTTMVMLANAVKNAPQGGSPQGSPLQGPPRFY
jgi:hypothetical protein